MNVRVGVLGPLTVEVDGRPVALGARKQRAVLSVLALNQGAAVSTDRLVYEVWGESAPRAARSVQVYVSALRAALGKAGGLLETVGRGYRLSIAAEQLDARRFEAAAAQAAALWATGDARGAAHSADEALSLWRGRVLEDLSDLALAQAESSRLEALRLDTQEVRFDAELALGRASILVRDLEPLVAANPVRERLQGQLMIALHRSGRQADALAAYQAARTYLVDELGVDPGQDLQELHAAILRDDSSLRVEPAELRARRHLPAPATALIGRRDTIDEVTGLLRGPDVRLVTATGPGGIGKTRLAVQAAFELADAFPDGVWFVSLAELREPELFVPTVLTALEVAEVPNEPMLRTLQTHLGDRQLLLLLDNFEQVDAAAPVVSQLLSAASGLRVLVTSRSALRLYGEHEHPVPELRLADEAVPLFAARASAADPTFRVTGELAETVAEVCSRLDCLPLAIELAAARIRRVPVGQMATALPGRLDLADAGPRDLASRQQTLRNAISWSHDLLEPESRRVFAAIAVFVGGCTEEAAGRVCGATSDQLDSLVSSSLLRRRIDPGEGDRFDMLETILEYAAERLGLDHTGGHRDAHAAYFLELAERAAEGLRGPDRQLWAARLDADRDNLRAAVEHLMDGPDPELALRLTAALGFHWYRTGAVNEATSWLEQTLAAAPDAPGAVRAQALHALGILVADQGQDARALALCEASGELFRAAGDRSGLARSLNSQGGIARDLGDPALAERRYAESVQLRRALGESAASLAIVLGNLAIVALDRGDLAQARAAGEECLDALGDSDPWLRATSYLLLADIAVAGAEARRGAELLERALPLLRLGGPYRLVEWLDSCAGLAAVVARADTAARLVGAADAELDRLAAQMVPADLAQRERRISTARASLGDDAFQAAVQEGRGLSLDEAMRVASSLVDDVAGG